ncbi:helix-turn-helix transcriptional regulator [Kitasatospora sp. NPDC096147]|uniref:helix-turn-helix transcriptional regulator n=1 Tax=Kitasatospora sp. NPDC096147 TaxID=3364093 RepID=UPI00380B0358
MTDTPARLLSLLSLLQTPREWPGSELADRLRVSPRTIRRDIERLRELGYPVEATKGAIGGYRLVAGAAMPPLLLDDEEAVAIAVGLRAAAGQAVEGIEEASVRALAKLVQVLPSRLRHRVGSLNAATVPMVGAGPRVDPEVLTTLAAAASGRERLRFGYRAGDGAETRRLVEPHRLVATGRRWYLVAFDNERDDWRIFRVDRVTAPQLTGARCAARELPAEDAGEYVRERLHTRPRSFEAVAVLDAPPERMRERFGMAEDELTALADGRTLLRTRSDSLEWIGIRLAALGCEFEVREPAELVTHLRELAARTLRAAEASGAPGRG